MENLNKKFENLDLEILNQDTNSHHRSTSNCDIVSSRSNKILLTPIKKSSHNTPRNQNENETFISNNASNIYTLRNTRDFNDTSQQFKLKLLQTLDLYCIRNNKELLFTGIFKPANNCM